MKDIPLFTAENGIASLVLQEIPYTGQAYIRLLSTQGPHALLSECIGFCRAAGAERIFAAGEGLECYPVYTRVLEMRCAKSDIPETDACLFPVTEATLETWRGIYNDAMKAIPNAAWMSQSRARQVLKEADAYFVHRDGMLLGIGKASADRIHAVVATQKGHGQTVMQALCGVLQADVVTLEVANTNQRAVSLYTRMGFLTTREVSCWFEVWKKE